MRKKIGTMFLILCMLMCTTGIAMAVEVDNVTETPGVKIIRKIPRK